VVKQMWIAMQRRARMGVIAGMVIVVALCAGLGAWAYRSDYQVLFADLAPRDAAAMTAELDKFKAPYRLAGDGNTILVPHDQVYKLRLKLMGKDAPLYGAVGFEVFNNADLGMTEFVQKVNYQRAIQGELTRTIQAIDEVQSARVHLAIPEQGLFKRDTGKAKASVTVTAKTGKRLDSAQVIGIQRLVAASVADVQPTDVTVLDQHGVALTADDTQAFEGGAGNQLDSKRNTEEYLLKKVNQVLEQTFGAGQAVASIDVALNLDRAKVTTEEVLPSTVAKSAHGGTAGVVVRERYSAQGGEGQPLEGDAKDDNLAEASVSETEYKVGRRVEQREVASGTLRRMTVAILVRQSLDESQSTRLKEVIASAVGMNSERGDAIVVQSMAQLLPPKDDSSTVAQARDGAIPLQQHANPQPVQAQVASAADGSRLPMVPRALAAAAVLLILAAGVGLLRVRRRQLSVKQVPVALNDAARAAMLLQIKDWIEHGGATRSREAS
jgi:flagellar M-ring protein FliF